LKKDFAAEDELVKLEQGVVEEIESWVAYAKESPMPDPAKATADVYVGWEVKAK